MLMELPVSSMEGTVPATYEKPKTKNKKSTTTFKKKKQLESLQLDESKIQNAYIVLDSTHF